VRQSGRERRGWRAFPRLAVLALCLCAFGARAEEPVGRSTVVVFGDSQAAGLANGLQKVLVEDSRFKVLNRTHPGAAVVHADNEWLQPVRQFVAKEKADIAVVMLGANDRLDIRDPDSGSIKFHTDAWREVYAKRADKIFATLTDAGLKVIWCGNPIARSEVYSTDMAYINEVLQTEAAKFNAQFVSLWDVVVDESGHYAAFGKDHDGVNRRMRADDGIHFSAAGYELVAAKIVGVLPSPTHAP
jgi:hypothetical protein